MTSRECGGSSEGESLLAAAERTSSFHTMDTLLENTPPHDEEQALRPLQQPLIGGVPLSNQLQKQPQQQLQHTQQQQQQQQQQPPQSLTQTRVREFLTLESLPPLPSPNHGQRCCEACCGFTFVTLVVVFCVLITHWAAGGLAPSHARIAFGFIYSEAAIAMTCLAIILLWSSPVYRSVETCFPIPGSVLRCLERNENPANHIRHNIAENEDDARMPPPALASVPPSVRQYLPTPAGALRTYCVRCLVWRPCSSHHCNICQRCVTDFDHHCGVFGRCIHGVLPFVGRGPMRGNMTWFVVLIAMGVIGCGTSVVSAVVAAVSQHV